MSLPLLLLGAAAGLLAVTVWWFRPIVQAVVADLQAWPSPAEDVWRARAQTFGVGSALMAAAPPGSAPARPTRKGPSRPGRRAFLRNSWLLGMGGALGAFGLASIGFLWPRLGGGFGAELEFGPIEDVLSQIDEGGGRFEFPAGRLYMVRYDEARDTEGEYRELNGGAPMMALYQKCVHLGCRVPWCASSRWFECPCHGSRYNRWGEYEGGPAPRGLDRFPIEVRDGEVYVNTSQIVTGPTRTTSILGEPAAGPSCV